MRDCLLESKKNPKVDLRRRYSFFLSIGYLTSLLLALIAFEWRVYESGPSDLREVEDEFEDLIEIPLTSQPPPPPSTFIPPEIVEIPDEEELEEEVIDLDMEMTENMVIEEFVPEAPEEDIDRIFDVVEEGASPVGGLAAFYKYLSSSIRYPKQARRIGIQGRITLRFVVERDGSISSIEVLRGIGGGCDEEAVRVLREAPTKWTPGKQRGRAVRSFFALPIYFKATSG